jgi:hypothetical protein
MLTDPEAFRQAWPREHPQRREQLRRLLADPPPGPRPHALWAALCEESGELGLALREYQLALRDNPDDVAVLDRLILLYRERGDIERALPLAERRLRLRPQDPAALRDLVQLYLDAEMPAQALAAIESARRQGVPAELTENLLHLVQQAAPEPPEESVATSLLPADADIARFVHLFSGRENIYARQWCNPSGQQGYSPVHQPFTFAVARNHLLGNITVGIYPVRLDGTVTFFAFDVDVNRAAIARARSDPREANRLRRLLQEETRRLYDALRERGISPLLEDSGYKGRHLWVFLEEPMDAAMVRRFGALFLAVHPLASHDLHVEFFPKQDTTGSGPGNLIKLPLGIHRRTGRRSRLLLPDGTPDENPFATLRNLTRTPRARIEQAILDLKLFVPAQLPSTPQSAPDAPAVPPAAPQPAWTADDFATHPELSLLLAHCPVLAALKERAEQQRRLSHDEQIVLIHALGHSSAGVLAVNYLFDLCLDVPPAARLQAPLAGNPISCPKIRKRIPHITGRVNCNCSFEFAPQHYPTPRLHLLRLQTAAEASAADPATALARAARMLPRLWDLRAELAGRIEQLEKTLIAALAQQPEKCLVTDEGTLRLHSAPGTPASLRWEPRKPASESAASRTPEDT